MGHQNKAIAQEVKARVRFDQPIRFENVHPVGAGREEDVSGRALLNLAGQCGGTGEGDYQIMAAGRLKPCLDLGQGGGEAGGGKNGDGFSAGRAGTQKTKTKGASGGDMQRMRMGHASFQVLI